MSAFIKDGAAIRTAKKASDPAFPNGAGDHGLTLRDWFAGQALAGLLANSSTSTAYAKDSANLAYRHADAMLAERSKQ